jgi:hypothetical protein
MIFSYFFRHILTVGFCTLIFSDIVYSYLLHSGFEETLRSFEAINQTPIASRVPDAQGMLTTLSLRKSKDVSNNLLMMFKGFPHHRRCSSFYSRWKHRCGSETCERFFAITFGKALESFDAITGAEVHRDSSAGKVIKNTK